VLGEFSRKEKSDSSLDLSGRKGGLLVVARQSGRLKGNALEDIVDERVQDGHASLGDTSVGVNLLQHLVDVGAIGLGSLGVLLASSLLGGGGLHGLLSSSRGLSHFVSWGVSNFLIGGLNVSSSSQRPAGGQAHVVIRIWAQN
jgi:hypothetical protein